MCSVSSVFSAVHSSDSTGEELHLFFFSSESILHIWSVIGCGSMCTMIRKGCHYVYSQGINWLVWSSSSIFHCCTWNNQEQTLPQQTFCRCFISFPSFYLNWQEAKLLLQNSLFITLRDIGSHFPNHQSSFSLEGSSQPISSRLYFSSFVTFNRVFNYTSECLDVWKTCFAIHSVSF